MIRSTFLSRLIAEATHIWRLHPGEVGQSGGERAVRARTAITIIAYRHEFTPQQLAGAFGWRLLKRSTREARVIPRHKAFLQYETYRERYAQLEAAADRMAAEA